MAEKKGFKMVDTDLEKLDKELKEYRKQRTKITAMIIAAVLVTITLIALLTALRSFDDYGIIKSSTRGNSSASYFAEYNGMILEYSNDGILCSDTNGNPIWNQSFEMTSPKVDVCGKYCVVYDRGASGVYIMDESGLVKKLAMARIITKVSIASQGTVAVMTKDENDTYIEVYDKTGELLISGGYLASKAIIPIDIALSSDAQKLGVASVDMTNGGMDSRIDFYNFGNAGKGYENNLVSSFTYEDTLVPEIDYVSDNTMIALTDTQAIIYKGKQVPDESTRITFDTQISSVYHNDEYIGVAYPNEGDEVSFHLKVYNLSGKSVMENETSISYTNIRLLANNEICVTGYNSVDLYTIHSIRKFSYEFESQLYGFFYAGSVDNYVIMRNGATERVRLKL